MAPKSRKTELADTLKREILVLDRAPGSDVDETALCQAFGLSRTPVREVFRDLDGLGYLRLREQRAPKVADLDHVTLRNFFLAAPMIYGAVLRLAAVHARADQVAALRDAQAAFRAALDSGSAADRTLANFRFHEITGDMAASVYLTPSFQRLLIDHARIGMTFYRGETAERTRDMDLACDQHDRIIAAIEAGDAETAAALAEAHWALSKDQIGSFLMPAALTGRLGDINAEGSRA